MTKKIILACLFFSGATCLFMYPVILKFSRLIPAFYSTDEPYGVIWSFWWLKYSWLHGISQVDNNMLAYPYGMKLSFFVLWGPLAKAISLISSEIVAYNILLLSTFVLAGLAMFLLVDFLTRNTAVSIFSGIIYAFCPYHLVRVWQHFGAAQIQWIPLYFLFFLRLKRFGKPLDAFMLAVSFALNYYYDVHYAYFLAVATAVLFPSAVIYAKGKKEKIRFLWLFFAGIFSGVVLILPALLPLLGKIIEIAGSTNSASAYSMARRPFDDLFSQSTRPLSYFLPFTEQPLWGGITRMFIGSKIWGESLTEHNVFLGFIPLALVFFVLRRKKDILAYYESKGREARYALNFFLLLCAACWFLSQPPWWDIFGFKLYMPSFFLYRIFPMVRAYGRFAVLLMLGVSVLAAFALDFIIAGMSKRWMKIAVPVLLSAAVLFEFSYIPSEHVIDLGVYPKAYDWLKEQSGDAAIAEYPLDIEGPNELYKFYQTKHGRPIINGSFPGTPAHEALKRLGKLSSIATAASLRKMGVRYVFVHLDEYEKMGLVQETEEAKAARDNKGFRFVQEIDGVDIYEVVSSG